MFRFQLDNNLADTEVMPKPIEKTPVEVPEPAPVVAPVVEEVKTPEPEEPVYEDTVEDELNINQISLDINNQLPFNILAHLPNRA